MSGSELSNRFVGLCSYESTPSLALPPSRSQDADIPPTQPSPPSLSPPALPAAEPKAASPRPSRQPQLVDEVASPSGGESSSAAQAAPASQVLDIVPVPSPRVLRQLWDMPGQQPPDRLAKTTLYRPAQFVPRVGTVFERGDSDSQTSLASTLPMAIQDEMGPPTPKRPRTDAPDAGTPPRPSPPLAADESQQMVAVSEVHGAPRRPVLAMHPS